MECSDRAQLFSCTATPAERPRGSVRGQTGYIGYRFGFSRDRAESVGLPHRAASSMARKPPCCWWAPWRVVGEGIGVFFFALFGDLVCISIMSEVARICTQMLPSLTVGLSANYQSTSLFLSQWTMYGLCLFGLRFGKKKYKQLFSPNSQQ